MQPYEERVGTVTHYWPKAQAASVRLEEGDLHVGDEIHIIGRRGELEERISTMELDHERVQEAHEGQVIGIHVDAPVRKGDEVLLINDPFEPEQGEQLRILFGDAQA